jgi:signal transduction histidine kinase
MDAIAMAAAQPISSRQWLARVGLVAALGASEVVVAALCGVGGLRLAALAGAALGFVVAYLVTPSPGKPQYEPAALRPVLAMRGASLLAIAVTGGLTSPMLPLLMIPIAIAWTLFRPSRRDVLLAVVTVALLLALFVAVGPPAAQFTTGEFALLAGWTTIVTAGLIGRRIALLLEVLRMQSGCLARLREGALTDAASRRRGLESMTTKLAHELKNPLAAIKSLVQVELQQARADKSVRRLEVVLGETERIVTILREYLDLERPVEEAHVGPVELDELMADVATLLAGRAEVAGVTLTVEGQGGVLHADARLLKEAIVNLTSNAIEATPRGELVAVTYEIGAAGARIVIRDSGRGMTQEVSTRIGTPFFTTREGGSGLGVVIARAAIAQHSGDLTYASTPGAGTIVTIALPLDPRGRKRASA